MVKYSSKKQLGGGGAEKGLSQLTIPGNSSSTGAGESWRQEGRAAGYFTGAVPREEEGVHVCYTSPALAPVRPCLGDSATQFPARPSHL